MKPRKKELEPQVVKVYFCLSTNRMADHANMASMLLLPMGFATLVSVYGCVVLVSKQVSSVSVS